MNKLKLPAGWSEVITEQWTLHGRRGGDACECSHLLGSVSAAELSKGSWRSHTGRETAERSGGSGRKDALVGALGMKVYVLYVEFGPHCTQRMTGPGLHLEDTPHPLCNQTSTDNIHLHEGSNRATAHCRAVLISEQKGKSYAIIFTPLSEAQMRLCVCSVWL